MLDLSSSELWCVDHSKGVRQRFPMFAQNKPSSVTTAPVERDREKLNKSISRFIRERDDIDERGNFDKTHQKLDNLLQVAKYAKRFSVEIG